MIRKAAAAVALILIATSSHASASSKRMMRDNNCPPNGPAALPAPSGLSYSSDPASYYAGIAITANSPTVTGTVDSYSVNPALPTGLSLHATTGVITGTPTTAAAAADFTVTATNVTGTDDEAVNITIAANNSGLQKTGGGGSWSNRAVANGNGVAGGVAIDYRFRVGPASSSFLAGLSDVLVSVTSPGYYASTNYAYAFTGTVGVGNFNIWENGSTVFTGATAVDTTASLKITADAGGTVRYYVNDVLYYTSGQAVAGRTLYPVGGVDAATRIYYYAHINSVPVTWNQLDGGNLAAEAASGY